MREEAEAGKARGYLDQACGEFTQAGYTVHRTRQCMLLGQQTGQYTPSEIDPADRVVLCCVSVFTETWLNNSIPDSAIQLDRLTATEQTEPSLKEVRPTVAGSVFTSGMLWCQDAVVVCRHCSPLVEFMIIKCRPFYLLREFSDILLVAVYIPPSCSNNAGLYT